jgi:hypothetical protein
MKSALVIAAASLMALAAAPASAQRGRPSITLFDAPNYQGQSRSFSAGVQNMADQGFNDRAQSARVVGRWRVCEDSRLRGRCVELSGDVADLVQVRLTAAISSIEDLNGGFGPGGGGGFGPGPGGGAGFGPGGGRPNAGPVLEGRTATFFANPPQGQFRNADDFCRRMGFSGVIYADDRGQLRDVLCRR